MNPFGSEKSVLGFIGLMFVLRGLFAFNVGLIDDDAFHWTWSQELMLSYYDHPGMIAWLEYLTTSIFGNTVVAVRLPNLICFTASAYMMWKLAKEMFGAKAAAFALLAFYFTPFFGIGGHVSAPEAPFILAWLCAAFIFWKYATDQYSARKTWILLGILMGLGLNSKFIIAMLAPGFGLYMLLDSKKRRDFLTPWPWLGVLIATVFCIPIFYWNIIYDWPGFRYQLHERHVGAEPSLNRWLQFFGAQVIFLTPVIYGLVIAAFVKSARFLRLETRWKFLFCLTAPSFLIFYPQPYFAEYKPHWSGAAYLTLLGAAGFILSQSRFQRTWTTLILIFLIPINLLVYSTFAAPWLPKAYRALWPENEWKTTYDLSNEFFGWKELGAHLKQRRQQILEETAVEVFFAAHRYETTAQTYWGVQEKVYQLSTTRSHYSVIQKNRNPEIVEPGSLGSLFGRDALFVTTEKYAMNPQDINKWDNCTPENFEFYRQEELSRTFTVWYCRNFQGITQ